MTKRGQDWTRILSEADLEAPGYQETVERVVALTAEKKRLEKERQDRKQTKRTRKK